MRPLVRSDPRHVLHAVGEHAVPVPIVGAEAREVLAHLDRAAVVARRAARGEVGRLQVGFSHWMDTTRIIAAVGAFSTRHLAIQLDLRTLSTPQQIAALRDRRLDVGFVAPPATDPSLASETVVTEPLVAALPATHRFAASAADPPGAAAAERGG